MDQGHDPRLSLQALRALSMFLEHPSRELSGAEIRQVTGLSTGTLYPLLMRLEGAGWLESRWEEVDPRVAGRPRRRLYRFTTVGAAKTARTLAELSIPAKVAWA